MTLKTLRNFERLSYRWGRDWDIPMREREFWNLFRRGMEHRMKVPQDPRSHFRGLRLE